MLELKDLKTTAVNTWCPGCGNFGILRAFENVVIKLVNEGYTELHNIVISSGIGCHGKIVDYINVNSFNTLHGRVPPILEGLKMANPDLIAVGFAGDGDAYGEGMEHLIFAAKRNIDITMIIHDNAVYGLTTGQFTPTSPKGFKGRSTPKGNVEEPINPLALMLSSGATFVARAFAGDIKHMEMVFEEAIKHKGFALIDVLQPCVTFFDVFKFYRERVYKLEETDYTPDNFEKAMEKAMEWNFDFSDNVKGIPIGIFYKVEKPTYEDEKLKGLNPSKMKEVFIYRDWSKRAI